MDTELDEISESLDRIGCDSEEALRHNCSQEFDVPKFPIERSEIRNHLLSRSMHGDQSTKMQAPASTTEDVRFHLSPENCTSKSIPKVVKSTGLDFTLDEQLVDTQFSVDEDVSKVNVTCSEIDSASGRRFVDYQRVCIGGDDTSGVSL
ncbi:unnamed protein product [Mesocestoides corti]|nr:unnamed protein product [Mesocestoides corti]